MLSDVLTGRPPQLDPQRRRATARSVLKQVRANAPADAIAHHGDDPRLEPLLATVLAMTEPDPKDRPALEQIVLERID